MLQSTLSRPWLTTFALATAGWLALPASAEGRALRRRACYRDVLPELAASRVTDLIIQPREGAPDIYSKVDGRWPGSDAERAEIAAFIDALLAARVEEWRPLDARDDRQHYDSTITLAAGKNQYSLRLREDGMVAVLGRELAGRLDQRSRAEVLAE